MTDPGDDTFAASLLEVSIETHETNASIVHATGELDVATAPTLAAYVRLALANSPAVLIIDLARVALVDSSGLGVLVESQKEAQREGSGTEMRLVITETRILKVFEVTGLNRAFSIYTSVDSALLKHN